MRARCYVQIGVLLAVLPVFEQRAIAALTGSVNFDKGGLLSGRIDYVVYDPQGYQSSITDYVYAYQIFNDASSTVGIDCFSVGFSPDIQVFYAWCEPTGPEDKIPTWFLPPTSVLYVFPTGIKADERSGMLFFTSDSPPETGIGVVTAGVAGSVNVEVPSPSPVPEPATLTLVSAGAFLALRRKRNV